MSWSYNLNLRLNIYNRAVNLAIYFEVCYSLILRFMLDSAEHETCRNLSYRPRDFFILNSNELEISTHKCLNAENEEIFFLILELSDVVFMPLITVKTPTIVGILTFMSWRSLKLSRVERHNVHILVGKIRVKNSSLYVVPFQVLTPSEADCLLISSETPTCHPCFQI